MRTPVCVRARLRLSVASARLSPRLPMLCARGARQVHLLHEGEGAPRVARPVQALGETVRPAATAVRVRGGAGAALLRVRCRAGRWAAPRGV
jgi:hypothetical protein